MQSNNESYNGWHNYETWNVALWIGNDEGLYTLARASGTYQAFKDALRELGPEPLASMTPDHVAWDSDRIDTDAIDALFQEQFSEETQ